MLVHSWHLPPLPEGVLYGLNFAISFVALQHLGLMLATKQPAMTAARLATIIRESDGTDREARVVATVCQLTSSQLAAAVSNVVVAAVGAALFSRLLALAGRPFLDHAEAIDTFRVMSPANSFTIWYAALTGVLLWLASVVEASISPLPFFHHHLCAPTDIGVAMHSMARRPIGIDRAQVWLR